jgi:small subunit ribosomal protein S6
MQLRRYETVFVLRPDLGEAQTKETIKRIEDIIASSGGDVVERDEWGLRDLAYKIRRERRGYYARVDYVAPGAAVAEVERNLKLNDGVLRYLSVMLEEEGDAAKARAEVEARMRQAEEAKAAAAERVRAAAAAAQARAESEQHREGAEQEAKAKSEAEPG